MATLLNLLDDLRDRLQDQSDTQIPKTTKVQYLNHGLRACFPKTYRTVRDATLALVTDTYEYQLPSAVQQGRLLRLEIEHPTIANRFFLIESNYDIVPGVTDSVLQFTGSSLPSAVGANIRITAARPFTVLASDGDVCDIPLGMEELPVLYAMGLSTSRGLDNRFDYTRYSTTQGQNAVIPRDIMEASQFWFSQFELLLERFSMPLPGAEL